MTKPRRGLVLGKFLPPHSGHQYLIDFARNYVQALTVVVDSLPEQPIPGAVRVQWLRQMFPDVDVVHLDKNNPQYPEEHPDFWEIWRRNLAGSMDGPLDCLFASEDYGQRLAQDLGAQFVPVDLSRTAVPVSGTAIRRAPLRNWQYLPRPVRPWFLKRVCIFGPESTGKSTLTRDLARHFNTAFVPEYARTHIEHRQGELSIEDIPQIARGQLAAEQALVTEANRVLFCDTDLLTTTIWSDWLYGECPDWIREQAERQDYDLYLVTDVDVPWVQDIVRYLPEERRSFLDRCVSELQSRGRPYQLVSGSWEQRFQEAVRHVSQLMVEPADSEESG